MTVPAPVLQFPALTAVDGVRHGFTLRVPGLDVHTDRESALERLDIHHRHNREEIGLGDYIFVTAKQVHGNHVAVVDADTQVPVADADGLVTATPRVCLGIYVADCGALFAVDAVRRVIGLAHSGKKGTEQGIAHRLIEVMQAEFGSEPDDLIMQLAPCIRPPHYEIDFAKEILKQCHEAGVQKVYDCGENTGADLNRFYSYRMEKGKTGRMLALLALKEDTGK